MGQQEVYNFLKKNKAKWFTSKEVAKATNLSYGSVTNNLTKLRRSGEVHFKESKKRASMFLYTYKN
jgi:CRP-like cAMP-binding protein